MAISAPNEDDDGDADDEERAEDRDHRDVRDGVHGHVNSQKGLTQECQIIF